MNHVILHDVRAAFFLMMGEALLSVFAGFLGLIKPIRRMLER